MVRPHLKFGGYEHGGGADELQHLPVDGGFGQVVVCHLNSQVEGLVVQLEVFLHKHADRQITRGPVQPQIRKKRPPKCYERSVPTSRTHLHFNQPVH